MMSSASPLAPAHGPVRCVILPVGREVCLPVAVFVLIVIVVMVACGKSDTEAIALVLAAGVAGREFSATL
jgi:hypothetical protein